MAEKFSTGHVNAAMATLQATTYANCVIGLFDGTQPATSNDSEGSANLLCLITLNGGAFNAGSPSNGLNFAAPVDGVMSKPGGAVWKGLGLPAAGPTGKAPTWFRVYSNAYVTGASTTAARWDGAISSLSTAELRMTNPIVVQGIETAIASFSLTLPRTA